MDNQHVERFIDGIGVLVFLSAYLVLVAVAYNVSNKELGYPMTVVDANLVVLGTLAFTYIAGWLSGEGWSHFTDRVADWKDSVS